MRILDNIETKVKNIENLTHEDFLQLTDYLTDIVSLENVSLKSFEMQEVAELQPAKVRGCYIYSKIVEQLKETHTFWDNIPEAEKEELRQRTKELDEYLTHNERILEAYMQANDIIMKLFRNNKNASEFALYDNDGNSYHISHDSIQRRGA